VCLWFVSLRSRVFDNGCPGSQQLPRDVRHPLLPTSLFAVTGMAFDCEGISRDGHAARVEVRNLEHGLVHISGRSLANDALSIGYRALTASCPDLVGFAADSLSHDVWGEVAKTHGLSPLALRTALNLSGVDK
jgi:hypothetical protein